LDFQSSVIAIEFGSDRQVHNFDVKLATFKDLVSAQGGIVYALRVCGTATLNLCSVASGFIDAYWEGGCLEWDVCTGWVILEEASLSSPDSCGRVYLGVRKARSEKEVDDWVRRFWTSVQWGAEVWSLRQK
jgi:myo-inositol-1(or 4)-monophosphatase